MCVENKLVDCKRLFSKQDFNTLSTARAEAILKSITGISTNSSFKSVKAKFNSLAKAFDPEQKSETYQCIKSIVPEC